MILYYEIRLCPKVEGYSKMEISQENVIGRRRRYKEGYK
jgi:hypothetical protein